MKISTPLIKSFFAFVFLLGSSAFGQSTYQINSLLDTLNSGSPCDSFVSLSIAPQQFDYQTNASYVLQINGTQYMSTPIMCTVDWGDGTTTTHSGQSTVAGVEIQFQNGISHVYSGVVNAVINVTVMNLDNQSSATTQIQHQASSCASYFYGNVQVDCNLDGNIDTTLSNGVQFDLLGNNGMVSGFTLQNSTAAVGGLSPWTYALSVNQSWLNANGYTLQGITSSTVQITPNSQITFSVLLSCDSTPPPNSGCVQGMVFCDFNGNGMQDSSEMGISNAPIEVQYQNNTYYGLTQNSGYYQVSFPNGGQGAADITVNAQWLAQNGYLLTNNTLTVTSTQCSAAGGGPHYNFAVNCDSAQVQNECVAGIVFCDANGDGFQNPNEFALPYAPIEITGTNATITVYSNASGYFGYYGTQLGGNAATVQVNGAWLTQYGYSSNALVTASTLCDSNSFVQVPINCGTTGQGCSDLWSAVSPWIGYYQNQTNYVKLKWGNYGQLAPGSYDLTLTFPVGVTLNTSSIANQNYVVNGNTITWSFNTANQNYFYSTDVISFFVPPGFPSGTAHTYSSTITATGTPTDCNSYNDNGGLVMILGNSYDPNDKTADKSYYIDPFSVDTLTYVIRFQNTGDAPAQDIYIIDTLSDKLDWSTMQMIETSHPMNLVDLGNGVMKFDFPGIWLPDSTNNEPESHGQLTYRIIEKSTNPKGSVIENTAHIFFDWNEAIITNTTVNVNDVLSVIENKNKEVVLYPNPVRQELNVQSKDAIEYVRIVNLAGQTMFEKAGVDIQVINMERLTPGIYMVEMKNNHGGISISKVIKR